MNPSTYLRGNIQTPDATPQFSASIPLSLGTDQAITIDCFYGASVHGDHTKISTCHAMITFYYTSATGIVRTASSDDAGIIEEMQGTMSTVPFIQFVPNNANMEIDFYFCGNASIIDWGFLANVYEY